MYILEQLSNKPHLYTKLISEIENAYEYERKFSYDADFYPLMNKRNWDNCYLILEVNSNSKEVLIGHIGSLPRKICDQKNIHSCIFIGGIYIKEQYRKKGIFKEMFKKFISKISSKYSYALLWSEYLSLYQTFGFKSLSSCRLRICQSNTKKELLNRGYKQLDQNNLSSFMRNKIKSIYNLEISSKYITPKRENRDWNDLFQSSSINLFIKKDKEEIVGYCLLGKGQDYQDIIHESAFKKQYHEEYKYISSLSTIIYDAEIPVSDLDILIPTALVLPLGNETDLINACSSKPLFISGADSI